MSSDEAPERRKRSKLLTICPFILGNECCERMAFYGCTSIWRTRLRAVGCRIKLNLVNYFRHIGASSSSAVSSVSAFVGATYCFPLLGGWIADSRLGRYKTIIFFSVLYVMVRHLWVHLLDQDVYRGWCYFHWARLFQASEWTMENMPMERNGPC